MLANPLVALAPFAALLIVACSDATELRNAAHSGGAGASGTSNSRGGAAAAASNDSAGSANGGTDSSDRTLIVPEGIDVSAHVGNNSVFSVKALTIRPGADGPKLYAAVTNVGDSEGCNASFSVTLYDKDEQTIGAGVSGLMLPRFYRYTDTDSSVKIAGCVPPGAVTMVAVNQLDMADVPIEDVRSVVYSSQYWTLSDIVAIEGVSLSEVKAINRSGGVAYAGALVNGLDTPLRNPTVAVFPINAVGRPLDVAYGAGTLELAPGKNWSFETNTVSDAGVGFEAYPLGGP